MDMSKNPTKMKAKYIIGMVLSTNSETNAKSVNMKLKIIKSKYEVRQSTVS
jgi:hypothetical protein